MISPAQHRPCSTVPASRSSFWLLSASLLVHGILLLLIVRSSNSPTNTTKPNHRTLKATLVYSTLPVAPNTSPTRPQVPRAEKIMAPEAVQINLEKAAHRLKSVDSTQIPAVNMTPPDENETVSLTPIKPAVVSDYQGPSTETQVQQQLRGFHRQAVADIAAHEAARYRQQLSSPSLLDKPAISQLSEDQKFHQARQVRANCASKFTQGVAILSTWTGGNIACSKPPDINSFIQDRLHKKAQLPARTAINKPNVAALYKFNFQISVPTTTSSGDP